ncbi:hypothetical protein PBAC_13600 [Pedobacter glucosidilyticus]|nr:hypothetical protein [Pedobacter glucosidilyticus]KHJ38354.1 hypothetical protein PBAC_13600 [Pedobacter glucosidilyticus]
MKLFVCSIILLLFYNNISFSQINKGSWLIGGSIDFTSQNTHYGVFSRTSTIINSKADIGYFLIDQLAFGVKPGFYLYKDYSQLNIKYFDLGVFSRYYFLKSNSLYNIIIQPECFMSFGDGGATINTYSLLAGPVIYFNERIGLEFNIGYSIQNIKGNSAKIHTLQSGIGLQIHLN